ncbi:MAG: amino acid adenylation domain-containing protein, partial [bacterium]|nr:amino acid adenylation domain-containing protein [bacterium]
YVIFTSGSTGEPKGVCISHANLSPLLHRGYKEMKFGPGLRTLRNLSYYFDWSVWEMFMPLTASGQLAIVSDEILHNPKACIDFMNRTNISVLNATPTQLGYLIGQDATPHTLRYLFIGAEKLSFDLVSRSLDSVDARCRVFNMYGPTETTIMTTSHEIIRSRLGEYRRLGSITIGGAVANLQLLVLDKHFNMSPPMVTGELYIGGNGVASGYLNKADLTAEKFIPIRCLKAEAQAGKSVMEKTLGTIFPENTPSADAAFYRTGDLVRRFNDGSIEFVGRTDFQVKIRGFRIELGEIESRLLEHERVNSAVVTAASHADGDKYICAYIVPAPEIFETSVTRGGNAITWGGTPDSMSEELRHFLSQSLPEYMLPTYYIPIEKLPLNSNGKVDKKALPAPAVSVGNDYIAPAKGIEKELAAIWADVLKTDISVIGANSDFFRIGGHSLKATALSVGIQKELEVNIPLTEIFINPTLKTQAAFIQTAIRTAFSAIDPVEKKEYYSLSSAQKRIYLVQQMAADSTLYNISRVIPLPGSFEINTLESIFTQLVRRHESLRTSFHVIAGELRQRIHRDVNFQLEHYDPSAPGSPEPVRPFDLSKAPLIRASVAKENSASNGGTHGVTGNYLLTVDIHHIVSDGTSQDILEREFIALSEGTTLAPPALQYKDYACWQNSPEQRQAGREQENFWKRELAGELPVLNLPTDFRRPVVRDIYGKTVLFSLSPAETNCLQEIGKTAGGTLFMTLLSAFYLLLARLTGQEDVIVGTPTAGRRHADLENIIGMFVNTLPLRARPRLNVTFTSFLLAVKNKTLAAFENQDYQFEDIVDLVSVERDTGRNPIFDIMFTLGTLNVAADNAVPQGPADTTGSERLTVPEDGDWESIRSGPGRSAKFDISFEGLHAEGRIHFTIEYRTALFKQQTVRRFARYFKKIISEITREPRVALGRIEIFSEHEKQRLLVDFNRKTDEFPVDKTLYQLFENRVENQPGNVALDITDPVSRRRRQLTYLQLDEKAGRVALRLQEEGAGHFVGLLTERSEEMMVGLLGILKSGRAYVPLNPKAPAARNIYMLKESNSQTLLAQHRLANNLEYEGQIICVEDFICADNANAAAVVNLRGRGEAVGNPNLAAYVIFTSGSTGEPKGVAVCHANVCPLLHWASAEIGISHNDRALQNLSYFFDASVWGFFFIFSSGASLYIAADDILMNPSACIDFITDNRLTVFFSTPSQFGYFTGPDKKLDSLRYITLGAEKLTQDLARRCFDSIHPECRLFNMYGPTETGIINSTLEISRSQLEDYEHLGSIPIGQAIGNTQLYVLDGYFNLCPLMVSGELFIGGPCVTAGYLNNPQLTMECFVAVDNPSLFMEDVNTPIKSPSGERGKKLTLYRTGDIVRRLEDGNIEFLRRIDHQVKIRGLRIEPGEIEMVLLKHPTVKEAVVL